MAKIIAVDFDGTLCYGERYPKIGSPNTQLISKLISEKKKGAEIVLWTCREGLELTNALIWLNRQGLSVDSVNTNRPGMIAAFGGDSRKIFANVYIDDRAIRPDELDRI